jgi:hypothetical protein
MHATGDEQGGEWGGMIAGVTRIPAGSDFAPLLRGLPGDRCPCPHWGYVIAGRFVVRYADTDQEETVAAGEAYYLPAGHVPRYLEDTEVFEVSPAAELRSVIEVMLANAGPESAWACPIPDGQPGGQ